MKWAYRKYEVETSRICATGIAYRPMANLRIIGDSGDVNVKALIDTGADHTLLPISTAYRIEAELFDDEQDAAKGVGGHEIVVIPGRVHLKLTSDDGSCEWTAIVGFADFPTPEDECSILGHAGCLEFFSATFDGDARVVDDST